MSKVVSIETKREIVKELSQFKRRISENDFSTISKKYGVSKQQAKLYWKNHCEFGRPEIKKSTGSGSLYFNKKEVLLVPNLSEERYYSDEEFCRLLFLYINSKISLASFLGNIEMSYKTFYDYMRNLAVSGRIGKYQILEPREYWKGFNLLDVVAMSKYPNSKRKALMNLDHDSLTAYKGIIKVLKIWLGKSGKINRNIVKDFIDLPSEEALKKNKEKLFKILKCA